MGAGCRECAQKRSVWRGGVIQFPWLIFSFFSSPPFSTTGVLQSSHGVLTPSAPPPPPRPEPERNKATTEGNWGRMRHRKGAPVSQHLAEEDFHGWLHLGTEEKVLRSVGIKVCPGCLSHRGLPQRIQMGFPEEKKKGRGRGSQPLADLTTQMRRGGGWWGEMGQR